LVAFLLWLFIDYYNLIFIFYEYYFPILFTTKFLLSLKFNLFIKSIHPSKLKVLLLPSTQLILSNILLLSLLRSLQIPTSFLLSTHLSYNFHLEKHVPRIWPGKPSLFLAHCSTIPEPRPDLHFQNWQVLLINTKNTMKNRLIIILQRSNVWIDMQRINVA
jgi:hypothetical protein